jgi:inorganic triphosphatase YgiF
MSPLQVEVEAKLVIRSEAPREIATAISQLRSLGEWSLRNRQPVTVRDTYFDTPDEELGSQGIALRLRQTGGECLITVKGPETEGYGVLERREMEEPWSLGALELVSRFVTSCGVRLPVPDGVRVDVDPREVLSTIGLAPAQDRTTSRVRRGIASNLEEGGTLAELAIDEVTYQLSNSRLRHHEVELELEGAGDIGALSAVHTELQRQFVELHPWTHSKYATGRAITALLTYLEAEGLIGADEELRPTSYGVIDEFLRQQPG